MLQLWYWLCHGRGTGQAGFWMAPLSLSCLTEIPGISPKTWSWTICPSLQDDGGRLCLGLEVDQGWDGSPGIACSLGKSKIPHFPLPGTHPSPAGVWGEPELCWGGVEWVGASQGKSQRAQISAREGIPTFVCSVLSLGHLSPDKKGLIPALNRLWWYFQCCPEFWIPLLVLNSRESP